MYVMFGIVAIVVLLAAMAATLLVAILMMFRPPAQVLGDAIHRAGQTPLQLLQERYNRGDVTDEEYEAIRLRIEA